MITDRDTRLLNILVSRRTEAQAVARIAKYAIGENQPEMASILARRAAMLAANVVRISEMLTR